MHMYRNTNENMYVLKIVFHQECKHIILLQCIYIYIYKTQNICNVSIYEQLTGHFLYLFMKIFTTKIFVYKQNRKSLRITFSLDNSKQVC